MKRTWNSSSVDLLHSTVSAEEYNQILDEWAEVVYRHLCQLSANPPAVSETNEAHAAERTETYV